MAVCLVSGSSRALLVVGFVNFGVFVMPPHQPLTAVVLDIGHAYTKVGFASESAPRAIIPTVVKIRGKFLYRNMFLFLANSLLRFYLSHHVDNIDI